MTKNRYCMEELKEFIKQQIIKDLTELYGPIDGIIQVKENKDLSKGNFSISLRAVANALNK